MTADAAPVTARVWWIVAAAPVLAVALVVVVLAGLLGGPVDGGQDDGRRAAAAEPGFQLASVAAPIADHYHAAVEHEHTYRQIPCYCGCDAFLEHRHLYDCFVRADGQGWDSHAAGCGICIAESVMARRLLGEGEPAASVRDAVVAQFGSAPPATAGA